MPTSLTGRRCAFLFGHAAGAIERRIRGVDKKGETMARTRRIRKVWRSKPTVEGAGVHLRRAFGYDEVPLFDPFLLLDDFRSNRPGDYIAGFPWHPHRGIETITYVLAGNVSHGDSLGNQGILGAGDVVTKAFGLYSTTIGTATARLATGLLPDSASSDCRGGARRHWRRSSPSTPTAPGQRASRHGSHHHREPAQSARRAPCGSRRGSGATPEK